MLSETASEIFGRLEMLEGRLSDTKAELTGNIKVTAPGFLGSTWLVPKLTKLRNRHPKLQLQMLFDDRILNLSMREADAAIRLYKPDQNDLMHHAIDTIGFHICGSKQYFEKHGTPKTAKDLKDHTLIGYPSNVVPPYEDPNWLIRKANVTMQNNANVILMNSQFGIHEAVRNGYGLAALPDYLYKNDKDVVTCLDKETRPHVTMYLVYMEDRKNSSRIQVIKDYLLDQ